MLAYWMAKKPEERCRLISHSEAQSIPRLFRERVRQSPDAIAYRAYNHLTESWIDMTWTDMSRHVDKFRRAISELSLNKGDRVGILIRNGPDWVGCDIAIMSSGCVTVPLYLHDSAENSAKTLLNSGCRLLFIDTRERWNAISQFLGSESQLKTVWIRETGNEPSPVNTQPSASVRVVNLRLDGEQAQIEAPADLLVSAEDVATIIYTSGTTATPKGVMLSHKAILWNADGVTRVIRPSPSDVFLSLLPLAHAFERTLGYYLPMMAGSTVAFARSPDTLAEDFTKIRPTVFLGVPRVYERIVTSIKKRSANSSLTRFLLDLTTEIGWRRFEAERKRGPRPGIIAGLIWPILNHVVAARVLAAFGGRLRIAVSGGAPLDASLTRFLCGVGLPLVEGYGFTEAAPVVTATTFEDSLPGSVGRPLDGVEVRFGPSEELFIRSPSMMLGYWHDPVATAEVLDEAGWFRTGDMARMTDGRMFILGRSKDVIALSTGEKVKASAVENAISSDPLFDQVCVFGDGRPCLAVAIVPDRRAWKQFARMKGFDPDDPNGKTALRHVLVRLKERLAHLSRPSQVRVAFVELQPWTTANSVLTPTLKIKRRIIETQYASQIEELYERLTLSGARDPTQGTRGGQMS